MRLQWRVLDTKIISRFRELLLRVTDTDQRQQIHQLLAEEAKPSLESRGRRPSDQSKLVVAGGAVRVTGSGQSRA